MKQKKRLFFSIGLAAGSLALVGLILAMWLWPAEETIVPADAERIIFAGTQEDADCTILLSQGSCIVIDTAEEVDAAHIIELLQDHQAEQIDCMILTHPDKDHVGGVAALTEEFPVGQVILPAYTGEKQRYQEVLTLLENEQISVEILTQDAEYRYGAWDLQIFPPEEDFYEKSNNYSLAVLAECEDSALFFAGDAQKLRMEELMEIPLPQVDLYKVAHHGRESKIGGRMIKQLSPDYAVVTARAPEPDIAAALREAGTQVFCTVEQDVIFAADKGELRLVKP